MALKKVVETNVGVNAEYWKIIRCVPNFVNRSIVFVIDVFKDKDASDSGKSSFKMERGFLKEGCTNEELSGNLRLLGYEFIKANPDEIIEGAENA